MRRSRSSGFGLARARSGWPCTLALVAGIWGRWPRPLPAPGTIDRISIPDAGGERNVLPTGSSLQCNAQNAGKCTKRAVAVDTANNKIRVVWASAANNLVPNDNNGQDRHLPDHPDPGGRPVPRPRSTRSSGSTSARRAWRPTARARARRSAPTASGCRSTRLASNLVNNDNNSANDVFTYNVATKALYRVSVAQAPAAEGTGASFASSVADDGSTSFTSYNALVPGATTTFQQVYVRKSPAALAGDRAGERQHRRHVVGQRPEPRVDDQRRRQQGRLHDPGRRHRRGRVEDEGHPRHRHPRPGGQHARSWSRTTPRPGPRRSAPTASRWRSSPRPSAPNKGIYKVGTGGMAGAGDLHGRLHVGRLPGEAEGRRPAVRSTATARSLAFQSSAKYNDLQINSDQVWTGPSAVTLVSHDQADATKPANAPAINPSISPDGPYVAFESSADNLVGDDFNGADRHLPRPARRPGRHRAGQRPRAPVARPPVSPRRRPHRRRSRPTATSSPSSPTPRTSWPATPTA